MNVKRGDVYWLDKDKIKVELGNNVQNMNRPFVVISNDKNNRFCNTVNIASLSSQINKAKYPMNVLIDNKDHRYKSFKSSVILTEQIFTINKGLLKSKLTSLNEKDLKKLNKALALQLDLK